MRKKRKQKTIEQRTEIAVRTDCLADIDDKLWETLQEIPLDPIPNVPRDLVRRVRFIQCFASITAFEVLEGERGGGAALVVRADVDGRVYINMRAMWPAQMRGMFIVGYDDADDEMPDVATMWRRWFAGVGNENDMEMSTVGIDWNKLEVWSMTDFFAFINELFGELITLPLQGEMRDLELGLMGDDKRWMKVIRYFEDRKEDAKSADVAGGDS